MKKKENLLLLIFVFIIMLQPLTGQTKSDNPYFGFAEELMQKREQDYHKRMLEDSLKKVAAESVWDQAISTEGVHQPDGYFTLNILNESNENAYIYIDGKYKFTVLKNDRDMDRKVKGIKTIYAITYDQSYKWGPVDLSSRKEEDFFWKLTIPEKQTFEIAPAKAQ